MLLILKLALAYATHKKQYCSFKEDSFWTVKKLSWVAWKRPPGFAFVL